MFNPEKPWDANDCLLLADFCESWLCGVGEGCFDSQYDYDDSNWVDFNDFATFAAENELSLPDLKETDWYYLHDALGSVTAVLGRQYNREDEELSWQQGRVA